LDDLWRDLQSKTIQDREGLNTFEAKQAHLVFNALSGRCTSEGDGFVDFFHAEQPSIGNLLLIPDAVDIERNLLRFLSNGIGSSL
jgi:hypothetical protein